MRRARIFSIGCCVAMSTSAIAFQACGGDDTENHASEMSDAAMTDSAPLPDVGRPDQSVPIDQEIGCYDVAFTFGTPPWTTPVAHQNVCTSQDIDTFYDLCINGDGAFVSDAAVCNAFSETNADCASCISGSSSCAGENPGDASVCDGGVAAKSWPAVIDVGPASNSLTPNGGACVAALSTASDACKSAYAYEWQCERTACEACTSDADLSACLAYAASDKFGCPSFSQITSACTAMVNDVDPNEAIAQCAAPFSDGGAPDFHSAYTTIATTLCGP